MDKETISKIYLQEIDLLEYQYQCGIIDMHTYDREMRGLEEWYTVRIHLEEWYGVRIHRFEDK